MSCSVRQPCEVVRHSNFSASVSSSAAKILSSHLPYEILIRNKMVKDRAWIVSGKWPVIYFFPIGTYSSRKSTVY
jgi:hypothetical protein